MARPVPPADDAYWEHVRVVAADLGSDGCTHVPDFFLDACLEHDVHYRTHVWLTGEPIVKREADARFRQVMQSRSVFGVLSPMALWRWAGVAMLGRKSWDEMETVSK